MQHGIYLLEANRGGLSRESAVLRNLVDALKQRLWSQDGTLQHEECEQHDTSFSLPADFSGVFRYKSEAKIISAGQDAFLALADYYKSSVFVDEVDLLPSINAARCSLNADVVKKVIWSSINTRRLLSLGPSSWRAVQLLEGGARFYFPCPPINLQSKAAPSSEANCRVLIIAHKQFEDSTAEAVVIARKLASRLGDQIRTLGFDVDGIKSCDVGEFSEAIADTHVHVGNHNGETAQLRIVDSWASGCSVVQRVLNCDGVTEIDGYRVEDGVNGLRPLTLDQLVNAVVALAQDPFLRRTLNRGGQSMVSTAGRSWEQIADILLG